eukprot:TRINITY_DN2794_c0_g1_i1.p1 TRINITY_DN2794_c0_g1~~TRINITY_DN2794_c0_g1_i1.p1  ORF type:complete len:165 (+),score=84.13 TRINITY_DN2794_c0_g1_i1:1-495(+)
MKANRIFCLFSLLLLATALFCFAGLSLQQEQAVVVVVDAAQEPQEGLIESGIDKAGTVLDQIGEKIDEKIDEAAEAARQVEQAVEAKIEETKEVVEQVVEEIDQDSDDLEEAAQQLDEATWFSYILALICFGIARFLVAIWVTCGSILFIRYFNLHPGTPILSK